MSVERRSMAASPRREADFFRLPISMVGAVVMMAGARHEREKAQVSRHEVSLRLDRGEGFGYVEEQEEASRPPA